MSSEDFRKLLVRMVKASGQEVIDRAEDLVGNGELIGDFYIYIRFPTDRRMFTACPTIEVTREHMSKRCFDVLLNKDEEKKDE